MQIVALASDITYYFMYAEGGQKFQMSDSHLILTSMNFFVPLIHKISEAWACSLMYSLFDILQVSDYNKKFNS